MKHKKMHLILISYFLLFCSRCKLLERVTEDIYNWDLSADSFVEAMNILTSIEE